MDGRHESAGVVGRQTKGGEVAGTASHNISDDGLEGSVAACALVTHSRQPSVDGRDDGSSVGVRRKGCEESKVKASSLRRARDGKQRRSALTR